MLYFCDYAAERHWRQRVRQNESLFAFMPPSCPMARRDMDALSVASSSTAHEASGARHEAAFFYLVY